MIWIPRNKLSWLYNVYFFVFFNFNFRPAPRSESMFRPNSSISVVSVSKMWPVPENFLFLQQQATMMTRRRSIAIPIDTKIARLFSFYAFGGGGISPGCIGWMPSFGSSLEPVGEAELELEFPGSGFYPFVLWSQSGCYGTIFLGGGGWGITLALGSWEYGLTYGGMVFDSSSASFSGR